MKKEKHIFVNERKTNVYSSALLNGQATFYLIIKCLTIASVKKTIPRECIDFHLLYRICCYPVKVTQNYNLSHIFALFEKLLKYAHLQIFLMEIIYQKISHIYPKGSLCLIAHIHLHVHLKFKKNVKCELNPFLSQFCNSLAVLCDTVYRKGLCKLLEAFPWSDQSCQTLLCTHIAAVLQLCG